MKVGFIGAGNMASAMIGGIINSKLLIPSNIIASAKTDKTLANIKEKYKIVLVGTDDNVDKLLPKNILSIHRTANQTELAEIYTAADIFANPTREEVLGLVNLEALACGTPVVTFKTGGSPECIDETCGAVVEKNDIDGMYGEIKRICETQPYSRDDCLKRAESFDKNEKYREYIRLYEAVNNE